MLRCATLLAFLVLTWTQQGGSTMYGNKCSSKKHMELFSILDKSEAAANKILTSEKYKEILRDVTKKFKSTICEMNLDAEELSKLILKSEKCLKKIQSGAIQEDYFTDFLNDEPMKHIKAYIEKSRKKKKLM